MFVLLNLGLLSVCSWSTHHHTFGLLKHFHLTAGTIKLNCQDDKCLKKMSSSTVSTPTNEITTEMETKKTKLKSRFPTTQFKIY